MSFVEIITFLQRIKQKFRFFHSIRNQALASQLTDTVHGSILCHLILLLHSFCHALSRFYLLDDKVQADTCLFVQISQIRPQFAAKVQIIKADRIALLDVISVHMFPPINRFVFIGQTEFKRKKIAILFSDILCRM